MESVLPSPKFHNQFVNVPFDMELESLNRIKVLMHEPTLSNCTVGFEFTLTLSIIKLKLPRESVLSKE